jgi:ferritin
MLASDKLIAAFNEQVGRELGASHQYVSIASYFDARTCRSSRASSSARPRRSGSTR